ncbi:MAG: hypothetical protein V3W18_08800 [candidate division Zixibacteria bacterium]
MERFAWFYEEIIKQISNLKGLILSILRSLPFLGTLPDNQLEWIFIGIIFVISAFIIIPLIKLSTKIAFGAVIFAALIAYFTSFSFWGILPFSGLGVAIVLFSNKFQMG